MKHHPPSEQLDAMTPATLLSKLLHFAGLQQVQSSVIMPSSLHDVPPQIARAMENEDYWDFNIFELEAATQKR